MITPDRELVKVDQQRFRDDTYGIVKRIIDVQKRWGILLWGMEEGKERKALWPVLLKECKEQGVTVNAEFLVPVTDKVTRARTLQGQMRNGEWLFPHKAPWFDEFQEEMLGFPHGKWDDQVDSFAHLGRLIAGFVDRAFDPLSLAGCLN
jgi:predicted phage terminase large subunit-like protein